MSDLTLIELLEEMLECLLLQKLFPNCSPEWCECMREYARLLDEFLARFLLSNTTPSKCHFISYLTNSM